MSFQQVEGQEQVKRMLQHALRNRTLLHAYLFHGPVGTGKEQMAFALAQAVLCEQQGDDACGQCAECRKVINKNHPNFVWIEPEGTTIKIDQIRRLQQGYSFRSAKQQTKIYIMKQADRMTLPAANSLLKYLEDPPSKMLAILLTDNARILLPTIVSRVASIPFMPIAPETIYTKLLAEQKDDCLSRAVSQLKSGVVSARELIDQEWFAEMRHVVIQLGKECLSSWTSALLTIQHKVLKSDLANRIDVLLDLMILWFKDMIHIQCGRSTQLVFADQEAWLRKAAITRDTHGWVTCMEHTLEARKRLRSNTNPVMALEQLIVRVQGGEACIRS